MNSKLSLNRKRILMIVYIAVMLLTACGNRTGFQGEIVADETYYDMTFNCGGIMEPVAVWVRKGGEWAIIHRCKRCGSLSSNRVAADDNPMKLMSIAMKPLCKPPFPLERIEEMTVLMGGDGTMK